MYRICYTLNFIENSKMISFQNIPLRKYQSFKETKKTIPRMRWRKQKSLNPQIFISKTYKILQNDIYKHIISWNSEGTNFLIANVQKFQQQVLPIYFRHRNFSSFVRQLNMYDFHKIRNDNNVNIFEHKQFKKGCIECLINIKRKGCISKKSTENDDHELISISEQDDYIYDHEGQNTPIRKDHLQEDKYQKTIESIGRISNEQIMDSLRFIQSTVDQMPEKKQKMEQFINSLPDIIESQADMQQKIRQLKSNQKYQCLYSKKDIRKIVSILKKKLPKQLSNDYLEELSIEEQILANKMDQDNQSTFIMPSLAILSTEKYLPRSVNLINSTNFCDDINNLFFMKFY